MKAKDYTLEYCSWCNNEVAIHAQGITPCPCCGKPLVPCSVCAAENDGCHMERCPYGCVGGAEDESKTATVPAMTEEELDFAYKNC